MKKAFKLIFIISLSFIFCGCSVDYNLTITNKKKIIENITVLDDNDTILKYNNSIIEFLNTQKNGVEENEYYADIINNDLESGLLINKNYKNFGSYIESIYFNKLFEKANINDYGETFTFETAGDYYRNDVFSVNLENHYLYSLDKVNVNIKFYNVVESHNADEVDEKNNIYTWILNKEDSYRNITFKLKDDVRYDVMFSDFFKRNGLLLIIISLVVIVIAGVIIYFKRKMDDNNRI